MPQAAAEQSGSISEQLQPAADRLPPLRVRLDAMPGLEDFVEAEVLPLLRVDGDNSEAAAAAQPSKTPWREDRESGAWDDFLYLAVEGGGAEGGGAAVAEEEQEQGWCSVQ